MNDAFYRNGNHLKECSQHGPRIGRLVVFDRPDEDNFTGLMRRIRESAKKILVKEVIPTKSQRGLFSFKALKLGSAIYFRNDPFVLNKLY